jgi:hypothetical protein
MGTVIVALVVPATSAVWTSAQTSEFASASDLSWASFFGSLVARGGAETTANPRGSSRSNQWNAAASSSIY